MDRSTSEGAGRSTSEGFPRSARFTLVSLLGHGANGLVYRAHDGEMDADVALKSFAAKDSEQLLSLKQEFRILADILHPNLVELYELFVEDSDAFFSMELIDGGSLLDHLELGVGASGLPGRPLAAAQLPQLYGLLAQLADGLRAVHAAGKLHRDIKPSNVMVTRSGRVVLLDFGFAVAFGRGARATPGGSAGTFAYMAPELLTGAAASPAADWYGIGAMLYEIVAGRSPFPGRADIAFQRKNAGPPPSLRELCAWVPEPLAELVTSLLVPDPTQRAGADATLALVAGAARPERLSVLADRPFVGRQAELAQLHAALAVATSGRPSVVQVSGPSGIGKSELVRQFVDQVEEGGSHLVLRGRCHSQEVVPYKSVDSVIDDLSNVLAGLPAGERDGLRPAHAAALARLFPVLRQVPDLVEGGEADAQADPLELRHQGFAALRDLLGRLARRHPLVVWIDDLQWGDNDSALLLRELTRAPEAPAVLWILSFRSEDGDAVPLPENFAAGAEADGLRRVELGPLDRSASRDLAVALCETQIGEDARVAQIVEEAGGSPFFVNELMQALARNTAGASQDDVMMVPRLSDVLQVRTSQLSQVGRELLEMVSIAGGPLPRSLALTATGLGERGRPLVSALERRSLLRSTRVQGRLAVEVYHDRFREALLSQIELPRRRVLHRRMADTLLAQPSPDPQALFTHFLAAGDRRNAGHYAVLAADAAAQALAFDQAADLYRQALDLRDDGKQRPRLLTSLAEALANAGRGHDAGDAFEAAAAAVGAAGGSAEAVLDLRRQAAEHFIRSGHMERGLEVTRRVSAALGIPFPETQQQALTTVLRLRAQHAWRGVKFAPRAAEEIAPQVRLRLTACRGISFSLGSVDLLRAEVFGLRHLLESLQVGEPVHVGQALQLEAIKNMQFGGQFLRRRASRLLQIAERLAVETNDPYNVVGYHFSRAACAFQEGRWRTVVEDIDRAREAARERWVGLRFERVTMDAFAFTALAQMGELQRLAVEVPPALAIAEERGDSYATLGLRSSVVNLLWLSQDRADEALAVLEREIRRWPTETFLLQHYMHLIATVHSDLYRGDVWSAWQRVQTAWPKLRAALYLWMESPGVELRNLRARVALSAALTERTDLPTGATPPDRAWPRERLLKVVAEDAKALAKSGGVVTASVLSAYFQAWLLYGSGQRDEAAAALDAATDRFTAIDMKLWATAARYSAGVLRGSEGRQSRQACAEWLSGQGTKVPERLVAVFAPPCIPTGG